MPPCRQTVSTKNKPSRRLAGQCLQCPRAAAVCPPPPRTPAAGAAQSALRKLPYHSLVRVVPARDRTYPCPVTPAPPPRSSPPPLLSRGAWGWAQVGLVLGRVPCQFCYATPLWKFQSRIVQCASNVSLP